MDDMKRLEILQGALQPMQGSSMGIGGMGGGMMGGMGGYNPMSAYNDYLTSWITANPDNPQIWKMVMEQLMQSQNPYAQWQMQNEMGNQNTQRMFDMMEMANMLIQSGDPILKQRGIEMQRSVAGSMSGYGAQPTSSDPFASMAKSGYSSQMEQAAISGDYEEYSRLKKLSELSDKDFMRYSQKPTAGERFQNVNQYGGIPGYALAGAGTGAAVGAGLGSVVPGIGTVIGGIGGGAIGAGAGTIAALLKMFEDEKIKMGRVGY